MNEKNIAAIALSNRDFPSFAAKLDEAIKWFDMASFQGADLVVLPEALNLYKGDGPGNPDHQTMEEVAFDDWQSATAPLIEAAARRHTAVTIPVITREPNHLTNSFFLIGRDGEVVGRYQKVQPTPSELDEGVRPGNPSIIEWEGLKIGGGICFDCYFPDIWDQHAALGADLFLVPSLTAGGDYLNFYALHHGVPIVLAYPAWSRIIDITGQTIAEIGYRSEALRFGFGSPIAMATLNFNRISLFADSNQDKMLDVQRAYGKDIRITFDQPNNRFILESRSPDLSVQDIVQKFGLAPLRPYFQAARYYPCKSDYRDLTNS